MTDHTELGAALDAIESQARSALQADRRRRALARSIRPALVAAVLGLVAYLAVLLLARLFGAAPPLLPLWTVPLLVLVPARLVVLGFTLREPAIGRREALHAVDAELGLADRLASASQFLQAPARTPFEDAACLDAGQHTARAREQGLQLETVPMRLDWKGALLTLLVALLLVVAFLWRPAVPAGRGAAGIPDSAALPAAPSRPEPEAPKRESPPPQAEPEAPPSDQPARPPSTVAKSGTPQGDLGDQPKRTQGATGRGRSAEASQASGSGEARGSPSSQAQESLAGKPPKPRPSTKKARPQPPPKPAPDKKEEESGSTTGRGLASGSTKSPAASEWQSKDQVTTEEEEPLDENEEVDDDIDEQEARGGIQPNLRDRRPPVNRDLTIGFGSAKPPPDANGRGGPSDQKKSRGVASLVLGVPLPDHVKGRPNPGRTKVTQERIEPQAEDAAAVEAAARQPRQAPVGPLTRPELELWMRDLVRAYFLSVRPAARAARSP